MNTLDFYVNVNTQEVSVQKDQEYTPEVLFIFCIALQFIPLFHLYSYQLVKTLLRDFNKGFLLENIGRALTDTEQKKLVEFLFNYILLKYGPEAPRKSIEDLCVNVVAVVPEIQMVFNQTNN